MQAALFFTICVAQAAVVPLLIGKRWPLVARWKRVIAATMPFPTVILLLCGFIYVRAATTPAERCGVDACAMAMVAAFIIAVMALFGALLAAMVALVMTRTRQA